jgi:hypothetical protein
MNGFFSFIMTSRDSSYVSLLSPPLNTICAEFA